MRVGLRAHLKLLFRVGQNHIYTEYVRYIWQENYQVYGHIRCIYTVLANPTVVMIRSDQTALQKHQAERTNLTLVVGCHFGTFQFLKGTGIRLAHPNQVASLHNFNPDVASFGWAWLL